MSDGAMVTIQPMRQMIDGRVEPRDEVYHRARLTLADRRVVSVVVVNLSSHGLMARTEIDIAVGEWITITLPVVGAVGAAVRWSLGGRIGCQLEQPVDPRAYRALLTAAGG